jgi:DNA mismatch endonuclease (patch repair protein)
MADVHTKETRSYNMSRIKDKNTKPEMLMRKFLHANWFRFIDNILYCQKI